MLAGGRKRNGTARLHRELQARCRKGHSLQHVLIARRPAFAATSQQQGQRQLAGCWRDDGVADRARIGRVVDVLTAQQAAACVVMGLWLGSDHERVGEAGLEDNGTA